jgi:hypothetical protein
MSWRLTQQWTTEDVQIGRETPHERAARAYDRAMLMVQGSRSRCNKRTNTQTPAAGPKKKAKYKRKKQIESGAVDFACDKGDNSEAADAVVAADAADAVVVK